MWSSTRLCVCVLASQCWQVCAIAPPFAVTRDPGRTLALPLPPQTAPKIFGGKLKVHLLVFTDAASDSAELAGVKEAAKAIKGKMLAVTVASTNDRVLSYFGITKGASVLLVR